MHLIWDTEHKKAIPTSTIVEVKVNVNKDEWYVFIRSNCGANLIAYNGDSKEECLEWIDTNIVGY